MFKSKREKQLEALVLALESKVTRLETKPPSYIAMAVPAETDQLAYWQKVSTLVTDPLLLFHLVNLRREIVDRFEGSSKDDSEFYRGQLAAIGQLFTDARKAKKQIEGVPDAL